MPDDFVIARNAEEGSTLPCILRIPLGDGILLKSKDTWPRTAKVYCHRFEEWSEDAEIVERVPVRSCVRRGAAVDLVLDRGRENRSQFVATTIKGGRQVIFWQTSRTAEQARPRVGVSHARAHGIADLEIVVDTKVRYAWSFSDQQAVVRRQSLPAGDYAVLVDGTAIAAVERKSLQDLVSSLTTGKLKYQLTDLAAVPRAAVVVDERYSRVLAHEMVRTSVIADALGEAQVAFPTVPIMFCETRKLAQEWTYRFLAAARAAYDVDQFGAAVVSGLATAQPLPPREPTAAEIRAWARANGHVVSPEGRIPAEVRSAYLASVAARSL
jgi:hypothetical protein